MTARAVVTALVTSAVCTAATAAAHAAPALPDVSVTLPVLGPRNYPTSLPFAITVSNRGAATATDTAVTVTSIPPTASDFFIIPELRAGSSQTVATRSIIGRILIGQVTVTARTAQRDAKPQNNTVTGFRFIVGPP